jgi:hypothetical protein
MNKYFIFLLIAIIFLFVLSDVNLNKNNTNKFNENKNVLPPPIENISKKFTSLTKNKKIIN